MLENIAITLFGLMLLSASFLIGVFVGTSSVLDIVESDNSREDELFCFECETETLLKENKGAFYCSECGLYHGSKL
jgi:ribosomal protein L37AE/L43A